MDHYMDPYTKEAFLRNKPRTKTQADYMISLFQRLLRDGPIAPSIGICGNITRLMKFDKYEFSPTELVCAIATTWEHSTHPGKFDCWPVPGVGKLWEGTNLIARQSLIRYCIKRIRDWKRYLPD